MDRPTIAEKQHIRAAMGHMYRAAETGVITINPRPGDSGGLTGKGHFGMRRNAQRKVVESLVAKGWLTETAGRFTVTPAGRQALDGEAQ